MKSDKTPSTWTGASKGSTNGINSFMFLIRFGGVIPAYILLIPVSFVYAFLDKNLITGVRSLRKHLNKKTNFFHIWFHCYNYGMALIDRIAFLVLIKHPFSFVCINENIISDAIASGKGVILVSAHVGNTEIAGNLLADRLSKPVRAVMMDNERADIRKIYKKAFEKRRINPISIDPNGFGSSIELVNALRNNEIVCLLADRFAQGQTEQITFCGSHATFPKGPFALARLCEAPMIPIFIVKTGLLHYTLKAEAPIHINTRDPKECKAAMQIFANTIESIVSKYPFQWFNFYNFWSQ